MTTNLPEVRDDLHEIERLAKPSVDVIVSVRGITNLMIGRYFHGGQFWQVDQVHGEVNVEEWWPMPVLGTGTRTNS
jgi:hypothetical protein